MFNKKIKEGLDNLETIFEVSESVLESHTIDLEKLNRFRDYVECFNCGNLVNIRKAKALAVLERDVFDKKAEDGFVLNGYTMRMAYKSMKGKLEAPKEDNTSTTIYFCQHCKAEIKKK